MIIKQDNKYGLTFQPSFEGGKVYFYKIANSHLAQEGEDWEFSVLKEYSLNKTDRKGQPMWIREVSLREKRTYAFLTLRNHQLVVWESVSDKTYYIRFDVVIKEIKEHLGLKATFVEYIPKESLPKFKFASTINPTEWIIEGKIDINKIITTIKPTDKELEELKSDLKLNKVVLDDPYDFAPSEKLRHSRGYSNDYGNSEPEFLLIPEEIQGEFAVLKESRADEFIIVNCGFYNNPPFEIDEEDLELIKRQLPKIDIQSNKFYIIKNIRIN